MIVRITSKEGKGDVEGKRKGKVIEERGREREIQRQRER